MNISISRLKTFKACRRMFQLQYIEGLRPVVDAEPLQTGKRYHELIELFYKDQDLSGTEFTKEMAMFMAFKKYIVPRLPRFTPEEWFNLPLGNGDHFIGRLDGRVRLGGEIVLIEHKSTSMEITEQYEYDLQHDEQVLAYMLATGARRMYYTACMKPTIRQKKNETDEEFFNRMLEWYDTDTEKKIRCFLLERTNEEVLDYKKSLLEEVEEVKNAKCYYRNSLHCFRWGRRCEYASICHDYDPNQQYIEFVKEEAQDGIKEDNT